MEYDVKTLWLLDVNVKSLIVRQETMYADQGGLL